MRYFQIINEEIFSTAAWVYHRTHTVQTVEAIRKDGFRVGEGDTYGRGIYATYEFGSQFSPYMKRYGDYVIRAKVNLFGYLIFDLDVARVVYGPKHDLLDQMKAAGMRLSDPANERRLQEINDTLRDEYDIRVRDNVDFESQFLTASKAYVGRTLVKGARGIVYTGGNDGRCIVAYDPTTVIPYSYTTAPADSPDHPSSYTWAKIVERERLRPISDEKRVEADPDSIMYIENPSPAAQIIAAEKGFAHHIKRPSPALVDYMVANNKFDMIARRVSIRDAKRVILANPLLAASMNKKSPVFNDPEVQRAIVNFGESDHSADDSVVWDDDIGWEHQSKYDIAYALMDARTVPDDVLDKLLSRFPKGLGKLFGRAASTVRDPEVIRKLITAFPQYAAHVKHLPEDVLRFAVEREPMLVLIRDVPPDLIRMAAMKKPMQILLNIREDLLTEELLRFVGREHPGVVNVVCKRRNIPVPSGIETG